MDYTTISELFQVPISDALTKSSESKLWRRWTE